MRKFSHNSSLPFDKDGAAHCAAPGGGGLNWSCPRCFFPSHRPKEYNTRQLAPSITGTLHSGDFFLKLSNSQFFLICCSGNSGFSPLLIGPKNTIQDSLLLLLLVHCTVVIFSWNCPIVKFFNLWFSQFGLYRYYFSIIGLFIAFSIFIKHFSIRLHCEKAALVWMVPQFCSWCTYFFSPQFACSSVGSLLFLYFIFSWKYRWMVNFKIFYLLCMQTDMTFKSM